MGRKNKQQILFKEPERDARKLNNLADAIGDLVGDDDGEGCEYAKQSSQSVSQSGSLSTFVVRRLWTDLAIEDFVSRAPVP